MKLFEVGKIPVYCDGVTYRLEKRKSGEVTVVDLSLKIPLSSQLAAAFNQAEYGFVKRLLFKATDASPVRDLRQVVLKTPSERQKLICFASQDTAKASIALDHVKVKTLSAKSAKESDAWVLTMHVSFGPPDAGELHYVSAFYTQQRFITFEEAEPSLEFETDDADDDDNEGEAQPTTRPTPMFDTDGSGAPMAATPAPGTAGPEAADDDAARQRLHSHAGAKGRAKTH